jgi:hypothetical protein
MFIIELPIKLRVFIIELPNKVKDIYNSKLPIKLRMLRIDQSYL